jgi:uncharacterized protein YgfB (UPF0149 family)
MGDVLGWIATTNEEEPRELLEQMHNEGVAGAETALRSLQQVWESDAHALVDVDDGVDGA